MKKKAIRPPYSLNYSVKRWFLIMIPLILLNIAISLYAISLIRQQNIDYVENSVVIYQNDMASKLRSVEHFLQWSIVREPLFTTMETTTDYKELISAIETFRIRVADTQYATGTDFQYFLYLGGRDMFLNGSPLQITYMDYLELKAYFLPLIAENALVSSNYHWNHFDLNGEVYFYYCLTYYDRTFFTVIKASDFIKTLNGLNLGKHGAVFLTDESGLPLAGTGSFGSPEAKGFLQNELVFTRTDTGLPFDLHVYLDSFGNFERLMLIQILVFVCVILVCAALIAFTYYLQNKVIRPIQSFTGNLSKIQEDSPLLTLPDSNILELEQANEQFKNLMHEIRRLKISIYEQELEKKRIQINFLQQQIRPHFYLNCLTTIYSMAQIQEYQLIEEMTMVTSKYLRYLFQTNRDYVLLSQEIAHINNYFHIQSLRYGPVFSYECNVPEELSEALVPPLTLITFMENSLKYGMNGDGELNVALTAVLVGESEGRAAGPQQSRIADQLKGPMTDQSQGRIADQLKDPMADQPQGRIADSPGPHLHLTIADNGPGFAPDLLERLNAHENLAGENGTRIGISNTVQRLALLYPGGFSLCFYNREPHGARIEIEIPFRTKEEES